jgi:hypothetical protein
MLTGGVSVGGLEMCREWKYRVHSRAMRRWPTAGVSKQRGWRCIRSTSYVPLSGSQARRLSASPGGGRLGILPRLLLGDDPEYRFGVWCSREPADEFVPLNPPPSRPLHIGSPLEVLGATPMPQPGHAYQTIIPNVPPGGLVAAPGRVAPTGRHQHPDPPPQPVHCGRRRRATWFTHNAVPTGRGGVGVCLVMEWCVVWCVGVWCVVCEV